MIEGSFEVESGVAKGAGVPKGPIVWDCGAWDCGVENGFGLENGFGVENGDCPAVNPKAEGGFEVGLVGLKEEGGLNEEFGLNAVLVALNEELVALNALFDGLDPNGVL